MTKSVKVQPFCRWTEDDDGNWETDCDQMHVLNDGTPRENKMRFCCYCGKPLREKRYAATD